ncbi:MAG: hypothetical protein EBS07_07165 [Sphingobacteriia bacterium]|nr:hypothetical protein [Sphingobacteriia bacterium]
MKKIFIQVLTIVFILGGIETNHLSANTGFPPDTLIFGFYNLENLFDTIKDKVTDDAEFLPASGWTSTRYKNKLSQLARVIDTLGGSEGPDLIGVCEAENQQVLMALSQQPLLKDERYKVIGFPSADPRGIETGVMFKQDKFKLVNANYFRIFMPDSPQTRTRDVLWVQLALDAHTQLGVFVCHWPSRRGGEKAQTYRQFIGAKLKGIKDSLDKVYPGSVWMVMGDLNDEPSDISVKDKLGSSGDTALVNRNNLFYNPMAALQDAGTGSHSYKNDWNMLDQILISSKGLSDKSHLQYIWGSAEIWKPIWMQSTHADHKGNPYPTFAGKNYLGGFSDHYPVCIRMVLQKGKKMGQSQ